MKREYFLMLCLIASVALILLTDYLFGKEKVMEYLFNFIVIWLMGAFYLGQYSMRFPKAF